MTVTITIPRALLEQALDALRSSPPDQYEAITLLRTALAQPQQPVSLSDAIDVVIDALVSDPDYAWGWHCNITMAQVDEGADHAIAEHGAQRFLSILTGQQLVPAHPLREKAQPQQEPVAYGIYDVYGKLQDTKPIEAEWKGDAGALGTYWGGNEPLYTADQLAAAVAKAAYDRARGNT